MALREDQNDFSTLHVPCKCQPTFPECLQLDRGEHSGSEDNLSKKPGLSSWHTKLVGHSVCANNLDVLEDIGTSQVSLKRPIKLLCYWESWHLKTNMTILRCSYSKKSYCYCFWRTRKIFRSVNILYIEVYKPASSSELPRILS